MLYDLEIKKEDQFVHAIASGVRTQKNISLIANDILDACKKHKADKVVIDIRQLTGRMPIFNSLSIIFEEFPHIKEAQVIKKAAIIDSEMRKIRYTFFESVARRRGYNIRIFSDPDAAVEWIREDI